MTELYDLQVTIGARQDGTHPVRVALTRRDPYPPRPTSEGDSFVLADRAETVGAEEVQVPADLFAETMLPAELEEPGVLGDPALLVPIAAAWPGDILVARMRQVRDGLFAGPPGSLLAQFRQAILSSYTNLPWEAPQVLGRISVEVGDQALQRLPWEMLAWDGGGPSALWARCAVVRRSPYPAGERTPPFALPLTVGVYKLADAVSQTAGWADGLFLSPRTGYYATEARDMGGLKWTETTTPPATAAVHHVVFSSGQGPGWSGGFPMRDRDGNPIQVGARRTPSSVEQLVSDLAHHYAYAPLDSDQRPPRLLVLHDVAAALPGPLGSHLAYFGLQKGADAVLVVHFRSTEAGAGGFFPWFYRKILHNWPVDLSLIAALAQGGGASEPVGWTLAARQGGETRLLLSQVVVEPLQAAPPPPSKPRRGDSYEAKGVVQPAHSRAARAAADLRTRVDRAIVENRRTVNDQAERVAGATFDEEQHSLGVILDAQAQVKQAVETLGAGARALAALDEAPQEGTRQSTVRLTNLWLTAGAAGQERRVAREGALVALSPYGLHVQIGQQVTDALLAAAFPDEALRTVFEREEKVKLDVVIFSPPDDFVVPQARGELELPRVGPSNELRLEIIPQRTGIRRLRTCIYYRNTMLQALLVEASVIDAGATAPAGAGVTATVDYVASTDLALLEELPQPAFNIFTNETPEGEHWLGVFGEGDLSGFRLRSGEMYTLDGLAATSEAMRKELREIEGAKRYVYAPPGSLDAQGRLQIEPRMLGEREAALCRLAAKSAELLFDLLVGSGAGVSRVDELGQRLQMPGLVSVARCRADGTTVPWAAFYYLDLDPSASLSLCKVFKQQLAENRWLAQGSSFTLGWAELAEQHDLLDRPADCRAQAACPLADKQAARRTVCPFGFWGFMHQIEQPLQQVKPTPVGKVPEEMCAASFNQTSLLVHPSASKVRLAIGAYADKSLETDQHRDELTQLGQAHPLEVDYEVDREALIRVLESGGQHVYYFYCHGEMEGQVFKLKVGTALHPGYISAINLRHADWRGEVQPLVILNGCETAALLPERIHVFLATLRDRGASGVVGTEIEVYPGLARPFGWEIVRRLLDGQSLGEAFLGARHHLLRQYNPLGLAYSFYAPATLHLHDPVACAWCQAHPPARMGGAHDP